MKRSLRNLIIGALMVCMATSTLGIPALAKENADKDNGNKQTKFEFNDKDNIPDNIKDGFTIVVDDKEYTVDKQGNAW